MIGWLRRLLGSRPSRGDGAAAAPGPGPKPGPGADPRPDQDASTGAAGPPRTRDASWGDVEAVAALLDAHRVDYVLVGGYAMAANGLVRQTTDIDVVVRDTPENSRRWVEALSGLPDGAAAELRGLRDPFAPGPGSPDEERGPVRIFDEFVIDVMPRACGLAYEDLEPHIGRLETGGRTVNVLDLHGLLLTKRGVREKDVGDRRQIEIALSRQASHPAPSPTGPNLSAGAASDQAAAKGGLPRSPETPKRLGRSLPPRRQDRDGMEL